MASEVACAVFYAMSLRRHFMLPGVADLMIQIGHARARSSTESDSALFAATDRTFAQFIANTASLPHLERLGPDYVAAVIAAFHALVCAEPPAVAEPDSKYERSRLAAAAVLPLTELLAASGPSSALPLADWMLDGGAGPGCSRTNFGSAAR